MPIKEEVLYTCRVSPLGGVVEIAKWDFHYSSRQPKEVYSVTSRGRGHCNCYGSMGNRWCKHKEILKKVATLGLPWTGALYDFDRDIFYTPEDGEGVPLEGAVDIWGMAIEQGKVI